MCCLCMYASFARLTQIPIKEISVQPGYVVHKSDILGDIFPYANIYCLQDINGPMIKNPRCYMIAILLFIRLFV